MRALAVLPLAALTAGACDDSVDVRLIAPAGEAAHPVDYACVNRVEVVVYSNLPPQVTCLPIAPGTIDTLRDHHLGGLLDVELPSGFAAMDVRGVRSDDAGCAADTVFHGEGYYGGGWSFDLPLAHALDCRDYTTAATPVQLLDLAKLLTGAADRCAPPAGAAGFQLDVQHQYPYDDAGQAFVAADRPLASVTVSAAGTGTIAGPHFTGAVDASCMTLATTVAPAAQVPTTTCIDTAAPTLCGPAGTAELIAITPAMATQFDTVRSFSETALSVVLVWDGATGRPLAGATVTAVPGNAAFGSGYFDFAGGAVSRAAGTTTTAAGLFAVEISAPTAIEVKAPGRTTRRAAIAAGSAAAPGVQVVVM